MGTMQTYTHGTPPGVVTGTTTTTTNGHVEDRPIAALLRDLQSDSMHLVQQEAQLFRAETSQTLARVQREAMILGAGAALAAVGGLVLAAFLVLLLAEVMPAWLSALIVGVVLTVAGGVAIMNGKKKIAAEQLAPKQTQRSVKEDIRTLREAWR